MKEIRNTTRQPLRVPLPKGGVLHLGPLHTGRVTASALEHPGLKKLVDDGRLEILGEGEPDHRHPVKEERGRAEAHGHTHASMVHPSGDR